MSSEYRMIDLKHIGSEELGYLVPIEMGHNAIFDVKRAYYIFNVPNNIVRGGHGHRNLEQLLICVKGSCEIVCDNGKSKQIFTLNNPLKGLYTKDLIWRDMLNFSNDCVIVVLASQLYDENDYVRNYDEFLKLAN